jgi:hypothetical protein
MLKTTSTFNLLFSVFLALSQTAAWSQNGAKTEAVPQPEATLVEAVHDFGQINENDGLAVYVFRVKNAGKAPLVIKQVQSSCGCTRPQWTPGEIAPGKEGEVEVAFDPKNRPGPFRKNIMIYTNDEEHRLRVTIMGDVLPKPENLQHALRDTIGPVLAEQKEFVYYLVRPGAIIPQEIWIQNFSDEDITLSVEDVPVYLKVETPGLLKSGNTDRFKVTLDGTKIDMKGHLSGRFTWKSISASGVTVTQAIPVFMNFIDDFTHITPEDKANAPAIRISSTSLEYGKLKKSGFLGLGNKRVSREVTITNTGKSELTLHDVSSDNEHIRLDIGKTTLQPEESVTLRIDILPKNMTNPLVADIYIICNDPGGPVREIRVVAEK